METTCAEIGDRVGGRAGILPCRMTCLMTMTATQTLSGLRTACTSCRAIAGVTYCAANSPKGDLALTPQEIEARRLVSIQEAAQLLSVSCDTIRRQYSDKFVRVSKRRLALRLR